MNHFIYKTILFLVIIFTPLILIEISIVVFKNNIFKENRLETQYEQDANNYAWIDSLDNNSINVITGSSTALFGLSCKELNKLNPDSSIYVNLAMYSGRDPIQTYFILKGINLNMVKNIYFGVDPWIYTKAYYYLRNSYLYLDIGFIKCFSYSEFDKSVFLKRYKSFFRFLFKKPPEKIKKETAIPKDFGSLSIDTTAKNFDKMFDIFRLEKYGWSELQFKYVRKIETLCFKNQINFNLFIPPKRSDYCKFYLEEHKVAHKNYLEKLDQIGVSSPIFSRFDLLVNEGDSIYFSDAYHLNEKGQIKFSKLFYQLSIKQNENFSEDYLWYKVDTVDDK